MNAVNEAYWQMDLDREMLERSLDLSSQELLQANSEMRAIFQAFPDLFFRTDIEGKILDYQASGVTDTPFFKDKVIGTQIHDLFPENVGKKFIDAIVRVQEIRSIVSIEYFLEGKDDKYFYEARLLPLLERQFVIIIRDITNRKRAEEALRESEQRLSDIIDFLPDATFAINQQRRVIAWNHAIEEMTGIKAPDMLGKGDYEYALPFYGIRRPILIDLVFSSDGEIEKKYLFVRKEGDVLLAEADVLLKGEGRVLWGKARPLYDSKGNIVGAIESIRDITDRKKLEAQLLQAQKMEAIGTLAGGIAHDFNNLLMGIQGYTSLMLFKTEPGQPHYDKLKSIEEQARSGAELTRQLLGFARRGKYEVKPTNLNGVIEKTSAMFGRTKRQITINRKFQEDLWITEVDQGQIEQVLLNLYVNAWQAMPGGGELFLETRNVILEEDSAKRYSIKPGKYVKMSVTDTGVGMDDKTKERIFEPFFTTKEMGRGTGLGLASVYGIINSHGGFINVYSEKGYGTTFGIYFPTSEKEVPAEKPPVREFLKGHETILVVDDEEMVIDVSRDILASLGYKVIVARGGQEAIQMYTERKEEIDLVILDMIMPGMGGGETYDILNTINPRIKVILSSGYSIDGRPAKLLERGCKAFMQKPYSMGDLSQTIRAVLDMQSTIKE